MSADERKRLKQRQRKEAQRAAKEAEEREKAAAESAAATTTSSPGKEKDSKEKGSAKKAPAQKKCVFITAVRSVSSGLLIVAAAAWPSFHVGTSMCLIKLLSVGRHGMLR